MKITVGSEKRHDGVVRWRLSVGLKWSHEKTPKRYREGFASEQEALDRRKELLAVAAASGMDGVCALVWGGKAATPAAATGELRGGMKAAVRQFLKAKDAAGKRERTVGNLKVRLGVLLKVTGDVPPRHVQAQRIQRWLDESPLSPRSRINFGIVWRNFFNWCIRAGHLDESPMRRVALPSAPRTLPAVLAPARLARLIAATWADGGQRTEPGPMLPYMLLLFFSGVRPEEVVKLTDWAQFSWDRGEVVLDESATKISRVRHCRLDARLVRVLRLLKDRGELPGYWSRRMFERVRNRAGTAEGRGWAVDIGRHTYASTRYALGTAEHDLSADMGNSVTVLRKHYVNRLVSREQAEQCWRVLEAVEGKLIRTLLPRWPQ